VAVQSVGIALAAGSLLGLLSGYAGGRTDQALMRLMDVFFSFPAILLALGIVAALGEPGNVVIAIAVVHTPIFARVVRGARSWRSRSASSWRRPGRWAPARCRSWAATSCRT
jgi:peptide/nickel transport system permease protein